MQGVYVSPFPLTDILQALAAIDQGVDRGRDRVLSGETCRAGRTVSTRTYYTATNIPSSSDLRLSNSCPQESGLIVCFVDIASQVRRAAPIRLKTFTNTKTTRPPGFADAYTIRSYPYPYGLDTVRIFPKSPLHDSETSDAEDYDIVSWSLSTLVPSGFILRC